MSERLSEQTFDGFDSQNIAECRDALCSLKEAMEQRNEIEKAKLAEMRAARDIDLNFRHECGSIPKWVTESTYTADTLTAKALGEDEA